MTRYYCLVCGDYSTPWKQNLETHLTNRETKKNKNNIGKMNSINKQLVELYPYKYQFNPVKQDLHTSIKKPKTIRVRVKSKSTPVININNTYVQNNVNITINQYRPYTHPDESMLTEENMYKLCKNVPNSAPEMFKIIYLNDQVPSNQVIHKEDIDSNELIVLTSDGWVLKNEEEIFEFFKQKYKNNICKFLNFLVEDENISNNKHDQIHDRMADHYEGINKDKINTKILSDLIKHQSKTLINYQTGSQDPNFEQKLVMDKNLEKLDWMKKLQYLIDNAESRSFSDLESNE